MLGYIAVSIKDRLVTNPPFLARLSTSTIDTSTVLDLAGKSIDLFRYMLSTRDDTLAAKLLRLLRYNGPIAVSNPRSIKPLNARTFEVGTYSSSV